MLNFQQTGGLMRWIDKLERRWGRYGIPNLMNIILVGQLIAWVIVMVINQNFYYAITLNRTSLMSGQIWRVVTFLFVPPLSTGIQLLLTLYFRWWVGNSLQRAWGDFRFMMYILVGMVGALAACLITGSAGASGIFLSLFFAYAWMWPEQQVLLFFILIELCLDQFVTNIFGIFFIYNRSNQFHGQNLHFVIEILSHQKSGRYKPRRVCMVQAAPHIFG